MTYGTTTYQEPSVFWAVALVGDKVVRPSVYSSVPPRLALRPFQLGLRALRRRLRALKLGLRALQLGLRALRLGLRPI